MGGWQIIRVQTVGILEGREVHMVGREYDMGFVFSENKSYTTKKTVWHSNFLMNSIGASHILS